MASPSVQLRWFAACGILIPLLRFCAQGQDAPGTPRAALASWDFASPDSGTWAAQHDCRLETPVTGEGLPVILTGADPYLSGPPADFPEGQALWMTVRLKSDQGGGAQVFFYDTGPSEERSVRFTVPAGVWHSTRIPLPPLGPHTRFRIDPPGNSGTCVLSRIALEPRILLGMPDWPRPTPPAPDDTARVVRSGSLELVHNPGLGAFELWIAGAPVAIGHSRAPLGYLQGSSARWLDLAGPASLKSKGSGLAVHRSLQDPDGGHWSIDQSFQPSERSGAMEVETRVSVDADRTVLFLPAFTLLPGAGSFGTNKVQGLLAGVEYLENEPSSSERDLKGPQARRTVPDTAKLTFPLMALSAGGRWVGLAWEPQATICALHDSPDRVFHSGGSAMALLFPGADPEHREDGSVLPYEGTLLKSGVPLVVRATLLGGLGETVVPALKEYIARRGLPALPDPGYPADGYYALAAKGWLDSGIRDGDRFRHAMGPTFGSQPAADAALYMDWLAARVPDASLADRLTRQSKASLALVDPVERNRAQVGHVRYPLPALVYGAVEQNAVVATAAVLRDLGQFGADGALSYRPPAGGLDLGSTHASSEASGLAGAAVAALLEQSAFAGNRELIANTLSHLRDLNRFRDTVPRGAQTWEVPLHTPDILASAVLVRAYTLGYELTGDPDYLEQARYWAWTGVPFVYLSPPTPGTVGIYAATPVLGATQFVAPNWIGLPVQWCGLVYADAIRRLAPHDGEGPWIRLADGITRSGIQQTHPETDPERMGLLPDSYDLRGQYRNPVPINPATLLPLALQTYGDPPVYGFHAFRRHGWRLFAPGPIRDVVEVDGGVKFRVEGWPRRPWYVLMNGLSDPPKVIIDGVETPLNAPHHYEESSGRLVLELRHSARVEVSEVAP